MNLHSKSKRLKSRDLETILCDLFGYDRAYALLNAAPLIFAVLVLCLLGLSGHWVTKKYYSKQALPAEATALTQFELDLTQPDAKQLLVDAYIERNGGSNNWTQLESINYNGVIFDALEHYSFVASKSKGGDLTLYVTNRNSETQLQVKDGVTELDQIPRTKEGMGFHVKSLAHLKSELYDPIFELALKQRGEILEMEEAIWQNMPVIKVSIKDNAVISELILYKVDLSMLARIEHFEDGSSRTYKFTEFQLVNGLKLPSMINADGNNGESCNIRYTEIKPSLNRNQTAADSGVALRSSYFGK